MISKIVLILLTGISLSAFAAEKLDWKKCDKEIAKFKCSGGDKAIYECLEKHDSELGKTCQETHEKGDKLFGKK